MADTNIEWATKVWNPIVGCTIVSPGCTNCYAMKMAGRLEAMAPRPDGTGQIGMLRYVGTTQRARSGFVWTGKVNVAPDETLFEPLSRRKATDYFVNSMSDLFHPSVPNTVIDRVFGVMALTPQHIYKVLTKRSDRMREYVSDPRMPGRVARAILDMAIADPALMARAGWPVESIGNVDAPDDVTVAWPLPNVWLGASIEDQTRADERIPHLLATPAAIRWLSCEPLLGPVRLDRIHETFDDGLGQSWESCLNGRRFSEWGGPDGNGGDIEGCPKVDWVVVGGESGPRARPFNLKWAQDLLDQCAEAGTAFYLKQLGAQPIVSDLDILPPRQIDECGTAHWFTLGFIKDKKGGNINEWPEGLRIRQMPGAVHA
ncbi:MAG TPA: phage Gp37/Gp68 family protein [Sphingobium sp.]|uniref:phage Gp37/Gp68 family protein n=1 Tax=Sphingobium sp. TaxID=1912891 RepID=UPI002ED51DE2